MEIKRGWATDFGKIRFDVTIQETDLLTMLTERGAQDPELTAKSLKPYDKFRIMDAEAEAWVALSLSKHEAGNADARKVHLEKVKAMNALRNKIIDSCLTGEERETAKALRDAAREAAAG